MIHFTSDPHYGHKNVISYCDRPFKDVKEMTAKLVENYNKVVGPEDTTIWMGDCFFCPKSVAKRIMRSLNGKKILIMGNHDKNMNQMISLGFDWACYEMKLNLNGKTVRLCHYPYTYHYSEDFKYYDRCPEFSNPDEWLIHGHVHEKWAVNNNMINVGVDCWEGFPVSEKKIAKLMNYGEFYNNSKNFKRWE